MRLMSFNSLGLMKITKSIPTTILASLGSIITSSKLVFSRWPYLLLGGAVTTLFWIIFNLFDQLLFFSPVVTFYLPDDAVLGFILSNIIAVLAGIAVSMNLFVIRHQTKGLRKGILSLFSGSSLGILSSTCASCSSLGFLLISTFGGLGITESIILTNFQTPFRIVSVILLIWAYISISRKLTRGCMISRDQVRKSHVMNSKTSL